MSTYREIIGKKIKKVSSDPSSGTDGEMWYNSTTGTLRGLKLVEAWSSGSPLSTARYGAGGAGTQTAGLCIAGNVGPTDTRTTVVEEYNGSGWAAGGALPTATRSLASAGTQTAAFAAGGYDTANTAEAYTYDGSSWTGIPALNTARRSLNCMGSGTTTAGLVAGGLIEPPYSNASEEYNGSSWSEGDNLNTARSTGGSAGTQTATILAGGTTGSLSVKAEQYDGTSWTEGPDINTARQGLGAAGTQTSAIIVGGRNPDRDATETWDGTSWSTAPATLATARYDVAPTNAGPSSTWMVAGGYGPSSVRDLTEEYNSLTSVITAAAFSSGTNFPTSSSAVAGAGPRDAALGIGGYPEGSPPTGKSFEYNGVAWSAEATLNPNTGTAGVNSAAGSQTACINSQSNPGPPYPYDAAGEYDGSSWSNANDRPTANYSDASAGTLTAALFFGGAASPSSLSNATLSYDGTNWTVEESMSTTRSIACGSGSSTAALAGGGLSVPSPATNTSNSEEYGGESWTSGGTMLAALREHRAGGTQTDTLEFGGRIQGAPPSTFRLNSSTYDGTTWSTSANLATARGLSGSGNGPVGSIWGAAGYYPGSSPNRTNTTEHFNVATETANIKDFTTS